MPLPMMKQKVSRMFGVMCPVHSMAVSVLAPTRDSASDAKDTMRRSYMSATAPAGMARIMIGSIRAVCTSATLSAEAVICVIAQAAPTLWIIRPRLDSKLASQMRRNTG